MNKLGIITIMLLMPTFSFAFFCPSTFNQIYIGDTIEQVKQQCGKPDLEETKEIKKEGAQEWNYYIPQNVAMNSMTEAQGSLKTSLTFDASGKAINISVNGIGVGSTNICGSTIQLGDTRDTVKSACGQPSFINKQHNDSNEQTSTKVTELTYKTSPPSLLVFANGKLKEKK